MKLSTAQEILLAACIDQIERGEHGLNDRSIPMLVGDPGIGKTAIVYNVAEQLADMYSDWSHVELLDLATRDPLDMGGYPVSVEGENGAVMSRVPPHWTKFTGTGLYFFDEYAQGNTGNQNVTGTVFAEHRVSEHKLPLGWAVCGATNKPKNRAGTQRIPTQIMSRIMWLVTEADTEELVDYGQRNGWHPFVTSYLQAKPTAANQFDPDAEKCPSSRAWQKTSNILNRFGLNPNAEREAVFGEIGPKASDFYAYIKYFSDLPNYRDVFTDPERAPVPEKTDLLWLFMGILAAHTERNNAKAFVTYLQRLDRGEFAVAAFKDAANRCPEINSLPEVRDFKVNYLAPLMT